MRRCVTLESMRLRVAFLALLVLGLVGVVAATGRVATPPLFETLTVLGKEVVRRRLRRAIEQLRAARPAA